MNEIIDELKKIREEYQITMFEISQGCQVKERSVQRWLTNGNSSKPQPAHFSKIKKFIVETRTKFRVEEQAEIIKYKEPVLAEINSGQHDFIPRPETPGKFAPGVCSTGLLRRSISLWRLKEITQDQANEVILLKVLQELAQEGRIKLIHLAVARSLSSDDVNFKFELGSATRDIYKNSVEAIRLYRSKPLSKEQRESKEIILNIQDRIDYLRADKRKFFDSRHGVSKEGEIEKEMLREDRQAELEQREAALRTARGIEKLAKDKE